MCSIQWADITNSNFKHLFGLFLDSFLATLKGMQTVLAQSTYLLYGFSLMNNFYLGTVEKCVSILPRISSEYVLF